ncbi:dihydrofolate reductase [Nonomuraea sp. NN258]|uniref:dihydrofolate reductase family protein n=1 Tax=Nonomuraea antri TaxID=2730852 RepID=UPI0015685C81|nr:dihydrofolate reductase family protein [Nonomuraea antri]NRQ37519.1 dihydrofolate reductase [Nonomuraea antri]
MRKMIAGLKISLDGMVEGSEGYADWVDAWCEEYGLTSQIDTCVLGGRMYPGYEQYWTAIQDAPDKPHPLSGKVPAPEELEWSRFAAKTPHYVLSNTLTSAAWPHTSFLRDVADLKALKEQPGKDIYLMGGAQITAGLIDAGLVDELRLIVYPLIAQAGTPLFAAAENRHNLELRKVQQLSAGRVSLTYEIS